MLTIEQKLIELGFTQDANYLDESITRDLVGDALLESHGWLITEDECHTDDIYAFSPDNKIFYCPVYQRIYERDPSAWWIDEKITDYDDLVRCLDNRSDLLEIREERDSIVDQIKQHIILFFKDKDRLELSLGV